SGLHLGIFLGFVLLLCRLVGLSPRRSGAVVLVVLAAYLLLAEPRPPLLRSAVMAAALCVGMIARRRYSSLNALAAAAIILLAFDPLQLFGAGFQLSFTIVTGLILLHRPVRKLLFGRWIRRRGLMVFRGEHRARRWMHFNAANWIISGITMGITAYLMGAPLVAHHFGLFSPYAMVLSLVLLVPVAAVLIPGYLSLALQFPMPNLAHVFSRLAGGAGRSVSWLVAVSGHLPGLCFELRPVGPAWTVGCYAVIALVWLRDRIPFGRAAAIAGLVAVAAATVYTQLPAAPPKTAQLHVLAVGAGQCAVLRTPSGRIWLIDAGTRSDLDVCGEVLEPFGRHFSFPTPSAAFVSHANTDHFNALLPLVRKGRLKRVYLNDYFGRGVIDLSEAEAGFLSTLAEHGVEIVRIRAGDRIQLDGRTRVEVLHPPWEMRGDLGVNETSLVLRVVCDDKSVLIPADIDTVGQGALCGTPDRMRSDVLILPHHGGWEETLPDFVRAVDPRTIVVSCSREPSAPLSGGDKAREFHRDLRSRYRYFSTRRNGWIHIRFGRGQTAVETMR
ncbi:MAG TPA: ComEC/Rec2 family competence protein, partial [Phycisphaerae bacterium]|nr:ComEC/Rec2 family competence protein [Phycisphaerae bacterium]